MKSLILQAAARFFVPLLLLFSIFLLLRGHNAPGGGFAGGLVAATAFVLYALAGSVSAARQLLRVDPRSLIAIGLGVAVGSGVAPLATGHNLLTGLWLKTGGYAIAVGTPLLFDLGVYLVVLGVTLNILFALEEE